MTIPVKQTAHLNPRSAKLKSNSDAENTSTSTFTPSETPPQIPSPNQIEVSDLENLEPIKMEESKDGTSTAKEESQQTLTGNSATQTETRLQDPGDLKAKKTLCRKHRKALNKSKKKSKAKIELSSCSELSSTSESSSSSESEELTESESSEEDDAEAARKRKHKAKKAKKLKDKKKKAKSRKHKEASEEDTNEESSDESSSEEEEKKKKSKSKKSQRSKKHRKEEETSETEEDTSDPLAIAKAQLSALNIQRTLGKRGRGGRISINDRLLKKSLSSISKGKKKKRYVYFLIPIARLTILRGSKVDFVRVDQLWDSSIHNYKLTETAEDADADEYDQYVFTVRRKFDWENKYTETVVDIKSKSLKEALTHVMGAVKGMGSYISSFLYLLSL